MSPRNTELPEGTDHIINGAMETGAGPTSGGGTASGFIGRGEGASLSDGTGGNASPASNRAVAQLKEGASSIKGQATSKVREYAEDGKARATTALDDFSKVVNDAAQSIDDRLGAEYGDYARKAATAVSGFADTLRTKQVDDLLDDARTAVRKSPVIAIGTAAALGFALIRLVKSGMADTDRDGTDA